MKYARFLNTGDYLGVMNKEHLNQVSNNLNENNFIKAERNAESCILEYMTTNYKIEEALNVGKSIYQYDKKITYPKGVYFEFGGNIVKSLISIVGVVVPESEPHWTEDTPSEEEMAGYVPFSQLLEFYVGDKVVDGDRYFTCLISCGYSFNNVRIPSAELGWEKVDFASLTEEEIAGTYEFDFDRNDYETNTLVAYNDEYYRAVGVVNFDVPELGVNLKEDDPRSVSICKHFTQLAVYELYKKVSPNNISHTVMTDYEASTKWLEKCNKMSINPGVERRGGGSDGTGVSVDWAIGEFGGSVSDQWLF